VILRAKEVLANLEKAEFNELGEPVAAPKLGAERGYTGSRDRKKIKAAGQTDDAATVEPQLGLFASQAGLLFKELQDLDLNTMTPLEAMNKLQELKKKAGG